MWCEFVVVVAKKLLKKKKRKRLKDLLLVLARQDWVERTTASQVERSDLTLLRPCARGRLSRRKAGCIAAPINKPLATKEAGGINVCPGALTLTPPSRQLLILLTLSPLLSMCPGPRQVELSTRASSELCSGCAFTDAVLQTRQWVVKWDFSAIITGPRKKKKATSHSEWMPRCSSPLPLLSTGMSNHH